LKNAFAIVTFSALMSACALRRNWPRPPPPMPQPHARCGCQDGLLPCEAPKRRPQRRKWLPNVELTGDLLYRITKAELEFKQGQWQGPYITMMALAQQTRDPRLARAPPKWR
jgi:hypothetical protein